MPILESDHEMRTLLERVGSVAVVGVSPDPSRPSHGVAAYLQRSTSWRVWFVNPNVETILGQRAYAALSDLPDVPDLVDVFRRAQHLPRVTDDAIVAGAGAVWFQLGLTSDTAARSAATAGLDVVQDHCLRVEHRRLLGKG